MARIPWTTPRPMSQTSITRRRGSRSAHTPPTSRNRTTGTIRAARTRPRSDAHPVRSSTPNEIATGRSPSPRYDVAWPTKNSRNCRSWSTPRLGRLNTGVSCTGGRREEHQSRDPRRIRAVRDRGTCLRPIRRGRLREHRARLHDGGRGGRRRYRVPVNTALLEGTLASEPAYRARQVWEWTARGAQSYEEMTNLPTGLRARLEEHVPFSSLSVEHEAVSKDSTVKTLFRTHDGHPVEAVLMRYRDGRRSICVSSQSGCPLTCTFCATGQMRFGRNLEPWEIVDQALHFKRLDAVDHCVFMGMGEPMLNLDNVVAAARRLPDLGITHRRTTISTVGWMPGLTRFVDEVDAPIRLALSPPAADPALRARIMPVEERYPLEEVLAECRRYHALRNRKVFVEYVMLAGVNDSPRRARELVSVLDPTVFKVNLIPYNPTGMYNGSSRVAIDAFKAVLDQARLPATVRLTRGRDIAAACGQLAATRY